MSIVKEVNTACATISKFDSGIIRVAIKDHAVLEANNLEENYNTYVELMDEDSAPFLIIVNDTAEISTEGRDEYNKKTHREVRKKDALVIKDPATMLLINSQVKFCKPVIPTQAFLDEPSAVAWLLSE